MKHLIYYLLFCFLLLGGSCQSRKAVVLNKVITLSIKGDSKEIWNSSEALKKISLKSLRVLIVDGTDTKTATQFHDPLYLTIPVKSPLSLDSLIESRFYNRYVLDAFFRYLPRKKSVQIIQGKMSEEELDSLLYAGKYDIVIAARQIKFDYKCRYDNLYYTNPDSAFSISRENTRSFSLHNIADPVSDLASIRPSVAYSFDNNKKIPHPYTRFVTYITDWELRRVVPLGREINSQLLIQQGGIIDYSKDSNEEELLISIAKEAGKSIAEVFN
ncbi:hypothetical protein [Parabacteroides sp. AM08-6]|uniref:hypothetical protein n=1 Tax=Parabacteroides sp. AM08-6 TaxID=2292053 RepID=UPI000EFE1A94|nr:hypothetical protein [Parabacteroides sp. AM08-6]RHJ77016.1 hypothetical protein DW103_16420 [Parabacteroides sp. AM08-6]